jgi:hypothetical protein
LHGAGHPVETLLAQKFQQVLPAARRICLMPSFARFLLDSRIMIVSLMMVGHTLLLGG